MKKFNIFLKCENICITAYENESIVKAVGRYYSKHPMNGCRGGGCGVCRIKVLSGSYRTERMSKAHISEEDFSKGELLACKVFPLGDMELVYIGIK